VKWTYPYPLVNDVPENYMPDAKWGGDLGRNWECTNFHTLKTSNGLERHMLFPGSEGGHERPWFTAYRQRHPPAPTRIVRYANWFFGTLSDNDSSGRVRMAIDTVGLLDWGLLYAFNSFRNRDGRVIVWG